MAIGSSKVRSRSRAPIATLLTVALAIEALLLFAACLGSPKLDHEARPEADEIVPTTTHTVQPGMPTIAEPAWPGCYKYFDIPGMSARDASWLDEAVVVHAKLPSASVAGCPTIAMGCDAFMSRNKGRDGKTDKTAYIAHSHAEMRCFMKSVQCTQNSQPPRISFFGTRLESKLDDEIMNYRMRRTGGDEVREFFFDISRFISKPQCYSKLHSVDPCQN